MVIFGGFGVGEKTNDIFRFNFNDLSWEKVEPASPLKPCTRAGHSAVLFSDHDQGDFMFVFGGKDDDNNKLNDLWKFSFTSLTWEEVSCENAPLPRSGHSASVYNNFMMIFGGIYEVTKELNDMYFFNMQTNQWICVFQEQNSPKKGNGERSPSFTMQRSPTRKLDSPRKMTSQHKTKSFGINPTATQKAKRKAKYNKLLLNQSLQEQDQKIELESPTSNSMKNSFLIKNADPSFDKSYA
jgi:N-acetylneuraminic acid mutarotase